MATVKQGWKMPVPSSEFCTECDERIRPQAVFDGANFNEVSMANACDSGCTWEEIDWPFVEGRAMSNEIAALGFEIVYA